MKRTIIKKWVSFFVVGIYVSIFINALSYAKKIDTCNDVNRATKQKKEWTFIIHMAADNNLSSFARINLKQLTDIGSNEHVNIIVQLDTKSGSKKITKLYYIEKDSLILLNQQNNNDTQAMDSGSPNTLINLCKHAIENYQAHHYAFGFWNHGTGIIDIAQKRIVNPFPLFLFNPETNLIELDRSVQFFDFVKGKIPNMHQRAISFDDSTGHYLSNKDLEQALQIICSRFLNGKKFDIICFDACLMSMIEVADIIKDYAHYMVGSQEVELGTGYDYKKVLSLFNQPTAPSVEAFAKHIVHSYENTYSTITNDYTQSAIKLSNINLLKTNIMHVANLLEACIKEQKKKSVIEAIKASRHKLFCTHFDEPSYIDLHHFYLNLLTNTKRFTLKQSKGTAGLLNQLQQAISEGLALIAQTVLVNVAGKNLNQAKGVSIYFPEKKIHKSYFSTTFGQPQHWLQFLQTYLHAQ